MPLMSARDSRRKSVKPFRTILLGILLLAPPVATAVGSKLQQYPRRFAEVIPGGLYRGGFPTARHVRNLYRDKRIKTIVSLTSDRDELKDKAEKRAAREASIKFRRFPMPGNGCGEFGLLDRAADALADKRNWPIFFHCAAGKQRSNATLGAYRMRICRWPLERALKELEDDYDLDREADKVLVDHLCAYAHWLTASNVRSEPKRR